MIRLHNQNCQVLIDEKSGGRIAQISIADLELLVEQNQSLLSWGCYPIIPWVGRLNNGQFSWQGKLHQMPVNFGQHAIHGTCFDRSWEMINHDEQNCTLEIDLGVWPFKGKARQTIQLSENALTLKIELESAQESFPACIGWHPWFKRRLNRGKALQLEFQAQQQLECDDNMIPTGKLIKPKAPPWDDCFVNPVSNPRIIWADALQLEIESPCKHWVVYNQLEHAICVEPQIGAANLTDAVTVTPHAPLCAQTTIKWQLM